MLCHLGFTSYMTNVYLQWLANPEIMGKSAWEIANPTSLQTFKIGYKCIDWESCSSNYITIVLDNLKISVALGWSQACVILVIGPYLWWISKTLTKVATESMTREKMEDELEQTRQAELLTESRFQQV